MENVKILIASDENKVREPLKKYFSAWGMVTLEFNKPPEMSTIKALSPQLIFVEKKYYGYCDYISESVDQQFDKAKNPGVVIVVKPNDKMPTMSEVGQSSILQIPYSPITLFDIVRQTLCFCHMEAALVNVSAKLDLIYDILIKELNHSEQWENEALKLQSEEVMSLEYEQILDSKDEIIPKSKSLILSLLEDVKNNSELCKYEGRLHLLKQYITRLGHELKYEEHDSNPVLDILKDRPLSRKELKIFAMITRGMTTEEIASCLFISPETVKSHRRNIRKKLSLVGKKVSLGDFSIN
ncbi:MAG: helix-turn-helix transcriptional regulator [Methylococcales bacterium]|nr:helix-turn-helix transcriptional regulator [Methylococcales bacterium]